MSKNETQKTGIFWGAAAVTAVLAAIIAWPTATNDPETEGSGIAPGSVLLPSFSDPLAAANMKIVTFDDEQGTLSKFEVLRDKETGVWTIPSRGGYPADAVEQMRNAANALVDLKVLDSPTAFAEDHAGFGVIEPNEEQLTIGDEGVGRLVSFNDQDGKELGSLIIGKPVEGQAGQVYVRIPGQDPVYSVALDDSPLTTKFEDWIEEDLLQLSSIDVQKVQLKDYTTELQLDQSGLQPRLVINTEKNYEATLEMEGTEWKLDELKEFDPTKPNAPGTVVEVDESKKLNKTKLDGIKTALDDLKFVNVQRKPEGISANLRADADFANDREASSQLIERGFYPVRMGADGEFELLSANGELTTTTKDGVKYILRFGSISGLGEKEDESEEDSAEAEEDKPKSSAGVNRYLMVSTVVDEEMFPPPALEVVPETLEDLDAMDKAAEAAAPAPDQLPPELNPPMTKPTEEEKPATESETPESDRPEPAATENSETENKEEMKDTPAESGESDSADSKSEPADEADSTEKPDDADKEAAEGTPEPAETTDAPTEPQEGEVEASGSGESTTVGEGQDQDADAPTEQEPAAETDAEKPTADDTAETKTEAAAESKPDSEAAKPADSSPGDSSPETAGDDADKPAPAKQETEEEKKERLAAVQEQITKSNERKIDARKERLANAQRRSRSLNERFADWYYVIPEETYSKLLIRQEDLFESDTPAPPPGGPGINFGNPGGFQPPGGFGN
ncbi:DUF4340 domain-containing protein [Stieleria varia]|uniref:DUF4340 domain-containing protein n=1 Tax=Stieleria varia TaxID=2528005 RepID=A0A5C6A393_9BACT|nr:DUF4340 domain-containing protein [Stieleria varia]TWT93835.1 hypothetical protein Pla52n_56630 [Stieleria varia]